MSWKIFEESAPKMATLGVERLNRKIAYLATLRKDGSPRLHPITPFIGNGMLFMFTEPSSPKIHDLRRDGRYALHCSVDRKEGAPLIEFLVSGTAQVICDKDIRRRAAQEIAASPVVTAEYILFEFYVDHILVVEYDRDSKRSIRHWQSQRSTTDRQAITEDGSAGELEGSEGWK